MTVDTPGGTAAFLGEAVYVINGEGYLVEMTSEEWQDLFDGKTELPEGSPSSSEL